MVKKSFLGLIVGILTILLLNEGCYGDTVPIKLEPVKEASSLKTQSTPLKTQAAATDTGTGFILVQDHFQLGEVNLSQGSLEFSETDLVLPGKNGLDVVLGRKYSSAYYDQERFGMRDGWAMTFDMKLYSDDIDGHCYIVNSDGAKEYRWWSTRGALSRPVNDFSYIKDHWNSGTSGEWKLYGEDGKKYTFTFWSLNSSDQRAYLTAIEDTYGNKITITRENGPKNDKRIQKITDTFGREIRFYYENSNGNLVTKITYKNTNGIDQNIVYRYDTNGCLAGVKAGNSPEKTYEYVVNSDEVKNINNQWTYVLDSKYNFTNTDGTPKTEKTVRYDYSDECLGSLGDEPKQYQYDAESFYKNKAGFNQYPRYLLGRINNPLGSSVEYEYGEGNGKARFNAVVSKTIIENNGTKTVYSFDYPRGSDPRIIGTFYQRIKYLGKVRGSETSLENSDIYAFASATVTNPLSITPESYTFNQGVPIVKTQGITSTETTWNFDKMLPTQVTNKKNGIVQSSTKTEYGLYNNPTKITTQKGNSDYIIQESSYYTDASFIDQNILHLAKTTSVSDVNTGIKRYSFATYTTQGKPYESYEGQDASGRKLATLTYDSSGRVLTQSQYGPGGTMTAQYSYNLSGATYTITQTLNGKTSTSVYETNTGKIKSSTDLNGATSTYTYDDYGRPTQVTYPDGQTAQTSYSADLKTTTTTAGGRTVTTKCDSLGRTVEVTNPAGEDSVKYTYYYGNLPSTVSKQSNGSGAWVQKKSYTYDNYLRKLTSTSADFGTTRYSYNDSTNTVSVTDPLGRTSTTKTDELGRTIQSQFVPDGSTTTSTYDAFGDVLTVTDPRNLIHKTDYDSYGRVIASYHTGANAGSLAKRSQTTYTSGAITQTQQFSTGNVLFRTYGFTYDNEGRLTMTKLNNSSVETLTYDESTRENAKGRLTTAENTDAKTQYDYDLLGRIKRETTTIKPLTKTVAINYTYNATNGNLASYSYPDGKAVTYTYDNNQRVKTMSYNGKLIATYTYNSNGTIQTLTYGNNTAIAYTYEKEVLLKSLTATSPQNGQLYTQSYTYDTVGRATQTQHNDYFSSTGTLTRDYTYTPKNELKTVAINNRPLSKLI